MSRSNPNDHLANPSTRWFEVNGEKGDVHYYDRTLKQVIQVPLPFTYMVLEELAALRGWHDASSSGIYSNEVRDTTTEAFVCKAFKGGLIAEGRYRDIKAVVNAAGGKYVSSCYIAYKADDGSYALGCIQFKGASLKAWMDFRQNHRTEIYDKAITIDGFTEGKKGRVVYRMPSFKVTEVSAAANAAAVALDEGLQAFLAVYMKRNKRDAAAQAAQDEPPSHDYDDPPPVMDSDIPFAWLLPLLLPVLALMGGVGA